MITSIHQPAYLPWLGYFHKIAASEVFIVLDNTQFEKNSFINRNKIKTPQGPLWLTIPVSTSGKFKNNLIKETRISDQKWISKHWKSIELNYMKSPFYETYAPELKKFYEREWVNLTDICYEMLKYFVKVLGIKTKIVLSSELKNNFRHKTDLVVDLCKEVGATIYLSGPLGKEYIEEDKFKDESIKLSYQNYHHPAYRQNFGAFVPYLSILDLLFNEGPNSLNIIMSNQKK